jgi:SAM-dependent methyltransferase
MSIDEAGMPYLFEIFEGLPRGGPGDDESTRRAFRRMEGLPERPRVLDIGCGCGMQTRELARLVRTTVVALDIHPPFLEALRAEAEAEGLGTRIAPVAGDMNAMSFADGTFDVVWCEGALFVMGFAKGLGEIRRLLRAGGWAAVSEAAYLTPDVPDAVRDFWNAMYPAIRPVEANLPVIEAAGLTPVADLERRLDALEPRYRGNDVARSVVAACRTEIRMNREYGDTYGYAFYVMQKA